VRIWNNYIGKRYVIDNPDGKVLQHHDLVRVHPHKDSEFEHNEIFYAYVIANGDDWNRTYLIPIHTVDGKVHVQFRLDGSNRDISFEALQPVLWWSEEHRTTQSPIFQALAVMSGWKTTNLKELPGYVEEEKDEIPF
jgi:hypothetical protein